MKKILLKVLAILIMALFIYSCNEPLNIDESAIDDLELKSAQTSKKSYIVLLNDIELNDELSKLKGYEKKQATVKSKTQKILKRAGITDGEIGHVYGTALKGFSVKIAPGQLKKLESDPSVKYIEEDQIFSLGNPIKPYRPGKSKKPVVEDPSTPAPQQTPWGISRVNGGLDGTGLTAWIIDSGIDLDHPDLNVDDSDRNRSFLGGKQSDNPDDQNGHGTHVAGTIGAINDTIGVIGVAAGATVVSVRVLDRRGSGSYSGVIAGINYVGANGLPEDVANMSLGGSKSLALDTAVINAAAISGVRFVLAAGNERDDANNHSPARANGTNVYTISAMSIGDNWASFSNYGNPPIDYCAPGVDIESTWKGGGYNTISGTSMAAPHVAGILLLGNIGNGGNVKHDPDGDSGDIIAIH